MAPFGPDRARGSVAAVPDKSRMHPSSGGETQYRDQYFFINPRIETGDERYAWLNDVCCVGEGRLLTVDGGPAVQYRVFKLDHD